MQNLSIAQHMKNQSQTDVFIFRDKALLDLISKTVV